MLTPPKETEPSALFLKLLEPQPSEVIDFPRKDASGRAVDQIRIRVLPHDQHDKAREDAFEHLKSEGYSAKDLEHVSLKEVVGDRVAKELIAQSCLTAKPQGENGDTGEPFYGRIFRNAEDVGKLRAQEVTVLFNAYMLTQDKYGPYEHNVDAESWVRRLMEGGNSFPLLSMDLPELASLTSSFAEKIYSMCSVLESRWKELPDTCKSDLDKFSLGTGLWSLPLEESGSVTTESSLDLEDAIELSHRTTALDTLKDGLE